jgi:hypothetical protein
VPVSMTGHGGPLDDGVDEPRPAPRDQDIDQPARCHHLAGDLAAPLDQLHRVDGQARVGDSRPQRSDDGLVGVQGRTGAAQQRRVAGLQRDPGGIGGDVGARLVDDADHPERDPHLPHLDAVGIGPTAHHVADRVRQARQIGEPDGHAADALGREPQPVDQGRLRTGRLGAGHILGVGGQNARRAGQQRGRHGAQRGVLVGPHGGREHAGGETRVACLIGEGGHGDDCRFPHAPVSARSAAAQRRARAAASAQEPEPPR